VTKKELHQFRLKGLTSSRLGRGRKRIVRVVVDPHASTPEAKRVGWQLEQIPAGSRSPRGKRSRRWQLSLLWLSVMFFLGMTGTAGILLLTRLPPLPNCQNLPPLAADGDRLYCAQVAAQSGKLEQLVAAMNSVGRWPENHALYPEAQRLMEQWSQAILDRAQQKINQGDLSGALAIGSQIPVSSPLYPKAQSAIASWKESWQRGEMITANFREALKVQNWPLANQQVLALAQIDQEYWSSPARQDLLLRQLAVEKEAWGQLESARELAKSNSLNNIVEAIALAGKVQSDSFVKAQAQAEQNRWSRTLVQIAQQHWQRQDYNGVVTITEKVPVNTAAFSEAQALMRLGQAAKATTKDNLLGFIDAMAVTRQIPESSPLHQQAQAAQSNWQKQLQDRVQLQFAEAIAGVDQKNALQLAIDQALLVTPERPQRQQAQTLIAEWRQKIGRINDRATLIGARQIANQGTMEQLKAAIELASQIQLGQPLRIEAQTAIAQWNKQIQVFEDQPILDLARTFAQQQDLIAAIQAAQQIRPGRPLYSEAQTIVEDWIAQVQAAEDRPVLEAALALAAQGRLEAAIITASQIANGRPLYGQAQTAIAQWRSQLQPIQPILPEAQ
jgi:hypothetical protein